MAAPEISILDDLTDAEDDARLKRAEADIATGRGVPHSEVREWILKWGTPDETPAPKHWFE